MSRIDQALRRAGKGKRAAAGEVQPSGAATDERVDPRALDEYPHELAFVLDAGGRGRSARVPGIRTMPGVRTGMPIVDETPISVASAPRARISVSSTTHPEATSDGGHLHLDAAFSSQCRRLAGILHDRRLNRGMATVALTCAVETPDKTATAVNLALTLTQLHAARVLLIDSDVRPPFVHELVGVPNDIGLGDLVQDGRHEIPLTQVSPLLHVLPVGRQLPDGGDGLTSAGIRNVVNDCAPAYDWIILNAPAMSLLPDAHVLASLTDGAVFVIGASTPFPAIESAIASLGREHIVATVLLGLDDSSAAHPSR